jgi:D-alanine-D-alanine ligase
MKKSRRVLVLMHEDLVPPESMDGIGEEQIPEWKTEYDVLAGLEALGHDAVPLGVSTDVSPIRDALDEFKPHICFNLLEEFHGVAVYDHYVVSYLELLRKCYTGCNPRGLMLAHDKALSKKILAYHRVPVPRFHVFPMAQKIRVPAKIQYPMFVKSLIEEGSVGIAQASVVYNDQKLIERIEYVHRQIGTDAIAEQYIDGRELYVGVMGNLRLTTLPIWELLLKKLPEDAPRIATSRIKWDPKYQKQIGVETHEAQGLSPALADNIRRICKRTYKVLNLTGYARIDLRLTDDDDVYVIEANPNPQLAYGEDFAESAHHAGIKYDELLHRIINLGVRYRVQWRQ